MVKREAFSWCMIGQTQIDWLFQPFSIFDPDTEPDSGDGVDGVTENHLAVFVEVLSPLGLLHELLHGLGVLECVGNEVVREQIGVLGNGTHEILCVAVVTSPSVDIFPCVHFVFHIQYKGRGIEWQRITIGVVEETVIVLVNLVGLVDLVFPFLLDGTVDGFLFGEWTTVAMQRHVTVGDIVTEDKEAHSDVVSRGSDWTASVLAVQHFEVVNDAVGNGLATVSAVATFKFVGFVEQRR